MKISPNMLRKISLNLAGIMCKNRPSSSPIGCQRFLNTQYPSCEGLLIEPKEQVLWLKLDRPQKFNAITRQMYDSITETLIKVNEDSSIKTVVLTGNGNYYSSGNDLTNLVLALQADGGPRAGFKQSGDILYRFVESFIKLEKFLIAAVNGPAIGIAVTTLPLCDYVIASDSATFHTPFTALGQCPEACSSVTLPDIMGISRANELLALNMTWDAKKAEQAGLVSTVVEQDKFQAFLEGMLYGKQGIVKNCYPKSLMVGKSLVRNEAAKQRLLTVNKLECETIVERWLSDECADALQKFMSRGKADKK